MPNYAIEFTIKYYCFNTADMNDIASIIHASEIQ